MCVGQQVTKTTLSAWRWCFSCRVCGAHNGGTTVSGAPQCWHQQARVAGLTHVRSKLLGVKALYLMVTVHHVTL